VKSIKTRTAVRDIKILDKSANLSSRMKNTVVRTKERAEETREPRSGSPTEYAVDSIQDKAQGAVSKAAHLPNPQAKARENISRAKGHFQEVKRQTPKERQRTAEQAQKNAHKAKTEAENLKKTASGAKETAQEAQSAVKDAKQTLKQARFEGRQALRKVRQDARPQRRGKPATGSHSTGFRDITSAPNAKMPDTPGSGFSRPTYLNKGVKASQSIGSTAETAEKSAKAIKSTAKGFKDTAKGTIKTANKSVKTSEQTAKQAVKTAQQAAKTAHKTAQASAKAARTAERATRAAAKGAAQAAKAAAKGIAAMVKATIAAAKGLIAAVAAGGWVAVLVIVIICMIGFIVGSIFGIFFANEPNPHTGQTAGSVMAEIDAEYTSRIDNIIASNTHDSLEMSGARASWKELLAVYAVKTATDPDNPLEVAVMDNEKAAILRSVFWDMTAISHWTESIEHSSSYIDENGNEQTDTWTEYILHITVSRKTPVEMAAQYRFTGGQKECLDELLKPEYISLWNTLLYGISGTGDGAMIEIAATQIGNVGGEPYWSWYGFGSREEWCACFVSWVAEQCGYIDAGIVPRFAWCPSGVQWFKDRDGWQDSGYTPRPGDIIFFDWEPDGECDHVGIVESVADGKVNTIEGNTSDSCRRRSYDLGNVDIYGYGVPAYN
jgi:lipopolysaccharide export LptBFGC system permease protein LptF